MNIEKTIKNRIDKSRIKNASIIIVDNKNTIFKKDYGEDKNNRYIIGSCSKSFTSLAISDLLKNKKIKLDDNIDKYLDNNTIDSEIGKDISIKDLLNHNSKITTSQEMDTEFILDNKKGFNYSNANYNLLSKIIESVSKKSYTDYMSENIFKKLDMNNTGIYTDSKKDKIVDGRISFFGLTVKYRYKIEELKDWIQGASGNIYSNSNDLKNYIQYYLNNDILNDDFLENGIDIKNNPISGDCIGPNSGKYCLGWICKEIKGKKVYYHTGKIPNFTSAIVIIPEINIGFSALFAYGDFLVSTMDMEELVEDIILYILEEDIEEKKDDYWKKHGLINIGLIIIAFIIGLPAILLKIKKIDMMITLIIYILFYLLYNKLLEKIDIKSHQLKAFVPDIWLILNTSWVLAVVYSLIYIILNR